MDLATRVSTLFMERGDHVFRLGHPCADIYVLVSGRVWLSQQDHVSWDDDDLGARMNALRIPRSKTKHLLDAVLGALNPRAKMAARQSLEVPALIGARQSLEEGLTLQSKGFEADLLQDAYVKLLRHDTQRKKAAQKIQRIWMTRRNRLWAAGALPTPSTEGTVKFTSRAVSAPAYFGESCLWESPAAEWDSRPPRPHAYSAMCESRVELLHIPRQAVRELLQKFSPWLPERFEFFREAVVHGHSVASHREHRVMPVDQAAVDIAVRD
jgi:CRP-like cAMP-binding protein